MGHVTAGLHVRWRLQGGRPSNAVILGHNYLRLQTPLHHASDDMDDASQDNIRNLKQIARELIERDHALLSRFFNAQ